MPVFDFIIIGSGVAGLSTALGLARLGTVGILSKDQAELTASNWAQGGMAAVMDFTEDSIAMHIEDTLGAGAGLCHPDAVTRIIQAGPDAARQLIDWGVPFDRQSDGAWHLTREGGHRVRRVLHRADTTGNAIEHTLLERVRQQTRISLFENHLACELWTQEGRCQGVWVMDAKHDTPELWTARAIILASGGAGQMYLHSSNPMVATGDGIALAYRAGAEIANMEFIQFHPTTLYDPGHAPFLLTEALRGEGAVLRLPDGRHFLDHYDPRAELAPRDIVARAIDTEMKKHQLSHVTLDISAESADAVRQHFPAIYRHCLERGYDLTREAIPVVPAAHYTCGGVVVDAHGHSSLPGLYAVGEVSATGLHGANRLASNSLLECVVGAASIVEALEGKARLPEPPIYHATVPALAASKQQGVLPDPHSMMEMHHTIQHVMWQSGGIIRNDQDMSKAVQQLAAMAERIGDSSGVSRSYQELRNLRQNAEILLRSALFRRESRGCHFNIDHPDCAEEAFDVITQRDQEHPYARPIAGADTGARDARSRP
ncbi:L-aspartate oxidase [Acidithiobacillus marinus]|uniref:L-aspartate oxidase n=1 Tax=Acidithiobacillus marinus TaxID=187490 RepID=A0A2I1DJD9_9PROT|nr:L-aspartate oxidase [Acidithiobacillus marinus]PKY09990.1 L-aspartate oxidase [Acidithiobacillus marinus]